MAKYLSVVERAYHGTIEEQDDTILWITHMIRNAGGDVHVLLRANSVNYAVAGQDASGLRFGHLEMRVPPRIDHDVEALVQAGSMVYAVREDLAERGIEPGELVRGVELIGRRDVARLFDQHDQIWHW